MKKLIVNILLFCSFVTIVSVLSYHVLNQQIIKDMSIPEYQMWQKDERLFFTKNGYRIGTLLTRDLDSVFEKKQTVTIQSQYSEENY